MPVATSFYNALDKLNQFRPSLLCGEKGKNILFLLLFDAFSIISEIIIKICLSLLPIW
jgi:hypothetical protein